MPEKNCPVPIPHPSHGWRRVGFINGEVVNTTYICPGVTNV